MGAGNRNVLIFSSSDHIPDETRYLHLYYYIADGLFNSDLWPISCCCGFYCGAEAPRRF